jgi:lysophospholipid acyltransferase (LPLAT)-like uncharacterized protein
VLVGGPNPREPRSRRRSGRLRAIANAVLAPIAVLLIRSLWMTYRFRVEDDGELRNLVADDRPVILTCWHEGIFVLAWYLEHLASVGAKVTYLISPSRDGDLAARMVEVLGGRSVRGSATRSGVKAMRGLYRAISRDRASPVVLPDGPTGPRRVCKPGSLLLAQLSGAHIVPIACAATPEWRLRTWDRMLVPPPFARVRIAVGSAYQLEKGGDGEHLERARVDLERRLATLEPGGSS